MPYNYMHHNDRPPVDQIAGAREELIAKSKQGFKALMLELVGEYETKGRKPDGTAQDWKARGRDDLRRDLKRKIEAL
jgi:hypothetical protein